VIAQGLLGGFRVRLNALMGTDLAALHGCLAQVVFGVLVSLAVCTSRSWLERSERAELSAQTMKLRRLALLAVAVVFVQLIFGAILRHTQSPLGQRGHLLMAFAVVAAVAWLTKAVTEDPESGKPFRTAVILLAALVAGQILLGIEAWLVQFTPGGVAGMQPLTIRGAVVRTAHVLLGSGILATAVVAVLQVSARSDRIQANMASPDRMNAVTTNPIECDISGAAPRTGLEGAV
jgi:cytochrome c oxidase assembly protein subunit 15